MLMVMKKKTKKSFWLCGFMFVAEFAVQKASSEKLKGVHRQCSLVIDMTSKLMKELNRQQTSACVHHCSHHTTGVEVSKIMSPVPPCHCPQQSWTILTLLVLWYTRRLLTDGLQSGSNNNLKHGAHFWSDHYLLCQRRRLRLSAFSAMMGSSWGHIALAWVTSCCQISCSLSVTSNWTADMLRCSN